VVAEAEGIEIIHALLLAAEEDAAAKVWAAVAEPLTKIYKTRPDRGRR